MLKIALNSSICLLYRPILAILLTVRGDNSALFWIGDIGDATGVGVGWVRQASHLAVCVSHSGGLPVLEGVTGVPFFPFFLNHFIV